MNQRIVVKKPGGLDALNLVEEQEPTPSAGQVKVRILAAGVAYGDVMLRRGVGRPASGYPVTPGYDFAGVVETLGPGVSSFKVGDPVAGLPFTGGYQQFICLPAAEAFPVPQGLSPDDVVSVMLNYTTALGMLTRAARLKAGDTALIHGAAGGVGTAMMQLARLRGVKMYGTVSSGKMNLVRQLGGVPIDYTRADFVQELRTLEPEGVTAVFDGVGGSQLNRSYRALARNGTLVFFGASSAMSGNNPVPALAGTLSRAGLLMIRPGRRVVPFFRRTPREQLQQDVAALLKLLEGGQIDPQIAQVLPLSQAALAQELLEGAKVVGKIILHP